MKANIYVGHALTHAPVGFIDGMKAMFTDVFSRIPNTKRVEFLGFGWENPIEVFEADIVKGVGQSDLVVIVLDARADGIIIELCAALWLYGIPVLLLCKPGVKLSGLLHGLVAKYPEQVTFRNYQDATDVTVHISHAIEQYKLLSTTPKRFPCLASFTSNPLFGAEADGLYKKPSC